MVDADTVVEASSLNYLVGSFVEDKKGLYTCTSSRVYVLILHLHSNFSHRIVRRDISQQRQSLLDHYDAR